MDNCLLKKEVYKIQDIYYKKKYINAIKNDNINEAKKLFERRKNVLFILIDNTEEMLLLKYINENEYIQILNSYMTFYDLMRKNYATLLYYGCGFFNRMYRDYGWDIYNSYLKSI